QIGPVHEIDIDMIGVEIAQTLLDRSHDPLGAAVAAIGRFGIADADFGDQAHIAPARTQSTGQRLLGNPHPVRLSGIETVDARVECAVHGPVELRRIDRAISTADFPAAEANGGDFYV